MCYSTPADAAGRGGRVIVRLSARHCTLGAASAVCNDNSTLVRDIQQQFHMSTVRATLQEYTPVLRHRVLHLSSPHFVDTTHYQPLLVPSKQTLTTCAAAWPSGQLRFYLTLEFKVMLGDERKSSPHRITCLSSTITLLPHKST